MTDVSTQFFCQD